MSEADVLAFDPWSGDMDSDAVTLRDKFVVARKRGTCSLCFGIVSVGERVRAQTQRSEEQRKVMTFRFCSICCRAMERYGDDGGDAIERRYTLGRQRAERQRRAL